MICLQDQAEFLSSEVRVTFLLVIIKTKSSPLIFTFQSRTIEFVFSLIATG